MSSKWHSLGRPPLHDHEVQISRLEIVLHGFQIFLPFITLCCVASLAAFQAKWHIGVCGTTLETLTASLREGTRVRWVLIGAGSGVAFLAAVVVSASVFSQPGCKDSLRDPHAKLGPEYRGALRGWCTTKRASSGFLWVLVATYIISVLHLAHETHRSSTTRSSLGRVMRASAAERRREATASAAAGDPALVTSLPAVDGRGKEEDAAGGRRPSLRADYEHGWQQQQQQQQRDPTEMFGMTPAPAVALDVVLDESARFAPARFPHAVRVAGMMHSSTADNDDEKDEEQEDQGRDFVAGYATTTATATTTAGNDRRAGGKKPGWWEATPDMTDAVAPPSHTTYVETERLMMPFPAAAAAVHPSTWTIDPIPIPTTTTTRPPPMKTGTNSGVRLPSHSFSRNVDLCAGGAAAIQEQACAAALERRGDRSAAGFGSGGHGRGISRTMVLASSGEGDDPCKFLEEGVSSG